MRLYWWMDESPRKFWILLKFSKCIRCWELVCSDARFEVGNKSWPRPSMPRLEVSVIRCLTWWPAHWKALQFATSRSPLSLPASLVIWDPCCRMWRARESIALLLGNVGCQHLRWLIRAQNKLGLSTMVKDGYLRIRRAAHRCLLLLCLLPRANGSVGASLLTNGWLLTIVLIGSFLSSGLTSVILLFLVFDRASRCLQLLALHCGIWGLTGGVLSFL
mmetsp:Transcript_18233/g.45140  ORF Transcript_18233/g.45140 Transcript_18233/m.45140 type:complete len:218 (-) Transcript_18233:5054-5707(-)